MEHTIYLDNCVFSELLKPEGRNLRKRLRELPHRILYSHVNIYEMRNNQHEYSELLEELGALKVQNPGAIDHVRKRIAAFEYIDRKNIFEEVAGPVCIDDFEEMLNLLHYNLGGQKEQNWPRLVQSLESHLTKLLQEIHDYLPDDQRDILLKHIQDGAENLLNGDLNAISELRVQQVLRARKGDPMRSLGPNERVEYLISTLSDADRKEFTEDFPANFAKFTEIPAGKISGFAMCLFGLGLTSHNKMFSGLRQKEKFHAQWRDTLHIEMASHADCFVTIDSDAFVLARSTFAYAGLETQPILLTRKE